MKTIRLTSLASSSTYCAVMEIDAARCLQPEGEKIIRHIVGFNSQFTTQVAAVETARFLNSIHIS